MKILAVGGGSGGHVTPVVAVLRECRQRHPDAEIRFWCDKKFRPQAASIVRTFDETIPVQAIASGKLRRYNTLSAWQMLRPSILLPNLRDLVFVAAGVIQSIGKLLVWRPDVVFTKGGFVCLPVGFAAHLLRIPLVIHDSDAHPGLTNRILSKWATSIATGAPLEYYPYPAGKSHYIGIPIAEEFIPFNLSQQATAKKELGFDPQRPLVVVTGGGLGAQRINDTTAAALDDILPFASVVLISGSANYDELRAITPKDDERFQLHAFVSGGMATMLGAADVVVARAGATTILELAALAKPTILIPNAYLTGGHQLKNAKVYADKGAVEILDEDDLMQDPNLLAVTLKNVLRDANKRAVMTKAFAAFSKPHAATQMVDIIEKAIKKQ